MYKKIRIPILSLMILCGGLICFFGVKESAPRAQEKSPLKGVTMKLPEPKLESQTSVEQALLKRRSVRAYKEDSISLEQISQLLWAAQGITAEWGGRTSPSAGALYPLEIYLVVGKVKGLKPGLYHYEPGKHSIFQTRDGDLRGKLTEASLDQDEILNAPVSIVITAIYERTMKKYEQRGIRYVHMEVGAAGENIYLQAESLGLGTVFIGAFEDEEVKKVLGLEEVPLGIMPIGKKI
ncbi:MAG: SagB/ThcOx family dehydrogenase [Candidatus Zixiibacteriota bacterium]